MPGTGGRELVRCGSAIPTAGILLHLFGHPALTPATLIPSSVPNTGHIGKMAPVETMGRGTALEAAVWARNRD